MFYAAQNSSVVQLTWIPAVCDACMTRFRLSSPYSHQRDTFGHVATRVHVYLRQDSQGTKPTKILKASDVELHPLFATGRLLMAESFHENVTCICCC